MNKLSNRAHRVFTFIVTFKRYDNPISSTLTFVDLAGSEDIKKSDAKGINAREAGLINKSLLTLGRVINALACNEKHVPYRDSKLTRIMSEVYLVTSQSELYIVTSQSDVYLVTSCPSYILSHTNLVSSRVTP